MCKIEVIKEKKVVYAVTSGLIKLEEAEEYFAKLKEVLNSIDTSQYSFILDASDFKPVFQDGKTLLQSVIQLYRDSVFKNKYYVMPKSYIAKKQASVTVAGSVPEYFNEVSSFDEAMSLIK